MMRSLSAPSLTAAGVLAVGVLSLAFLASPRPAPPTPSTGAAQGASTLADAAFYDRLASLEAQLAAAPDDAELRLTVARLLHDAHRHAAAAGHFERYLAVRPTDRQAWLDLANVYAAAGRWAEAERASRALLDLLPSDPSAWYNLGAIAANTGRPDEARAWWSKLTNQTEDLALRTQAAASLERLDALAREGTTAPPAERAPPLRPGQTALPPGHPPIAEGEGAPIADGWDADVRHRMVVARPIRTPG